MKVGFLCVSYRKDREWCGWCVQSYLKFTRGFSGLMLVVPTIDYDLFKDLIQPGVMISTFEEEPGKGMLDHEVQVCSADQHAPHDWDLVAHIDSDAIFAARTVPEDYLGLGKPILWAQRYAEFRESNPNKYLWKSRVQKALGIDPEWETMSRMPMIYWRWMYPKFRAAVEAHVGQPFREFVLAQENRYPQGFAEFPSLGAFALATCPEEYCFGDISIPGQLQPPHLRRPENIIQFWSHGGMDRPIDYTNSIVPYRMVGWTPRLAISKIMSLRT